MKTRSRTRTAGAERASSARRRLGRVRDAWAVLRGYNAVTTVLDVGFLAGQYSAWERYEECGVVLNPYAAEVARPALRLVSGGGR